ncbi:MAG: hypothetical protein KatS3mg102_1786 [Planctomycetota bacterium]|nr:MAG: hypothetical protein KatS3mg102_1786 [Planctomycetota bacterium]
MTPLDAALPPEQQPPQGRGSYVIRLLATAEELAPCTALQKLVWGYADLDVVPVNELVSVAKAGGIVLGAFAEPGAAQGGRPGAPGGLVGFCFGLLAREPATGRLYHFSRMLAVHPAWRGAGLGTALKQAQRAAALAQGLDTMRWTFDPLRADNAAFNLARLGAVGVAYHRDLYGAATSSPLHLAGTDRLEVRWRLDRERPALSSPGTGRMPGGGGAGTALWCVPVPAEVEALAARGREAVRAERLRLRAAIEQALARGLVAVGFVRRGETGPDGQPGPAYLFGPDPFAEPVP